MTRLLHGAYLAAIAALAAGGIAGYQALASKIAALEEGAASRTLVLETLTLVDRDGAPRLRLQAGGADHPTLIAFFDGQQQMRWLMVTEQDGQSGLSLIAPDSPRWSLALAADGVAYEMRDGIMPMIAEWPQRPPQDASGGPAE